jgi:hypothetical protein
MKKIKIKLELQKKTVAEKLAMGKTHTTSMDGNIHFPAATRVPDDAAVQLAQADLTKADAEADAAEIVWKEKILIRNDKEAAWDVTFTARANNCESVKPNDPAALQSTGFPLRTIGGPIGDLPAPGDLRATPRKKAGEIDLRCDTVKGAGSYEWECRLHTDGTPWSAIKTSLTATIRVTDLTPGALYAFRVRAIGAAGAGDWSDEAIGRAP